MMNVHIYSLPKEVTELLLNVMWTCGYVIHISQGSRLFGIIQVFNHFQPTFQTFSTSAYAKVIRRVCTSWITKHQVSGQSARDLVWESPTALYMFFQQKLIERMDTFYSYYENEMYRLASKSYFVWTECFQAHAGDNISFWWQLLVSHEALSLEGEIEKSQCVLGITYAALDSWYNGSSMFRDSMLLNGGEERWYTTTMKSLWPLVLLTGLSGICIL